MIVEVLSSDSIRRDCVIKFTAYEVAGVTEYWIANPNTRTVGVFILAHGEYAAPGEFKAAEIIQSQVAIQVVPGIPGKGQVCSPITKARWPFPGMPRPREAE